jgi:spore maturation protein SpmA
MLNRIWLAFLVVGVLLAGFTGRWAEATDGAIKSAGTAVTLAIGLVGIMAMWLGMMRLAERAGLVQVLARALRPLMVRLFPDVPPDHPAMGSMLLNIAANALGLTNAATPLGLRSMRDLESLNPHPGTATNAMCTFLAINTGSVQLIPVSAIAVLAAAGATHPTSIVGTTLLATTCSSLAGLIAVKWMERWPRFRISNDSSGNLRPMDAGAAAVPTRAEETASAEVPVAGAGGLGFGARTVLFLLVASFCWFAVALVFPGVAGRPALEGVEAQAVWIRAINAISLLAIPFLLAFFPLYAALRGVAVYEEFVAGATEGFTVAVKIIPYLVAMLVAIGVFRGGGGIELLTRILGPALNAVRFPIELLPMALLRPLTGSGTLAALGDLVKAAGPDSLVAKMGGTLFGSTETTFYVIAVYFGSVGIRRTRHALPAGLIADGVGIIASVVVCRLVFS